MKERWKFIGMAAIFLAVYFIPLHDFSLKGAAGEAFFMLQDYAREHVLLCLVPAFFIAGAIAVFISQNAVIKYFGPDAKKWIAYSIASISGTILAVCSCTVLPIFSGIYRRGAGLGPAIAFLYSGPAINILAIILTAKVLGFELGIARAAGAVVFSVVIGLLMHFIFRQEEQNKAKNNGSFNMGPEDESLSLWGSAVFFTVMIGILVFANWGKPLVETGFWNGIYSAKWYISGILLLVLLFFIKTRFSRDMLREWLGQTWFFTKQIMPLLFIGVLFAGFLLGRPGHPALIPESWISGMVGGNSLFANFFASIAGAFMYFATLTEVPILQGLIGSGMGKGPALALLLAGPALSLPNMLVIRGVIGTKKTIVYVALVVIMATGCGILYGAI